MVYLDWFLGIVCFFSNSKAHELIHRTLVLIQCVQIHICILLHCKTYVPLRFSNHNYMLVFVWRNCTGCRKQLAVQYENLLCNMTINHEKKTKFYGLIILYKTVNVINHIIKQIYLSSYGYNLSKDHNSSDKQQLLESIDILGRRTSSNMFKKP